MHNRNVFIHTLLLFLFLSVSLYSVAQDTDEDIDILELTDEDYFKIKLPPLPLLFENAKRSSNVKFFDIRQKANTSMLRTEKRDWLKYFKLVAGYQYGVMSDNSYLANQTTPQVSQVSGSKQSWYNVGISVSVPFDDLFDRNNRVKRRKLEMEATAAETERWYDEQKIRIIQAYTLSLQFLTVLKAKSETMVLASAQYKIAESDFINGKIDAADLSARKSVESDAIVNYAQTKASLNMYLLQLEVLSNTKIINNALK